MNDQFSLDQNEEKLRTYLETVKAITLCHIIMLLVVALEAY